MKVLVVGGGGHVGGILRPALDKEHQCRYLDIKPIPDADSIVGDITDPAVVKHAVEGMEGVIYLAMGRFGKHGADLRSSFDVNVLGLYLALYAAGTSGLRHFVYASTMSIYRRYGHVRDESFAADGWDVYGLTKGLGEVVCQRAAGVYPEMCIVMPRMIVPHTDEGWAKRMSDPGLVERSQYALGPNDTRRLYLAAIRCDKPGAHGLITTGDVQQVAHGYARAKELLGWQPEGN